MSDQAESTPAKWYGAAYKGRPKQPVQVRSSQSVKTQRVTQGQHLLFFLLAAYQLLIPVTLAADSSKTVKLLRIGILVGIFVLGIRWLRWPRSGDLGASMMTVVIVFVLGAVWSDNMVLGLMFKGLFFCSVLGGVALARSIRNEHDFKIMLRHTVFAAAVGGLLVVALMADGRANFSKGRLVIGLLNPNFLGQSSAIFGILSGLLVYFERDKRWRFLAICVFLGASGVTVLSGSRAAFLMLFMGAAVLVPLWFFRRSGLRVTAGITVVSVAVVGFLWYTQADSEPIVYDQYVNYQEDVSAGTRIFVEAFRNNRVAVWWYAWKIYREYPIAGRGWFNNGESWAVVQSSYMQVLIETGLIGGVFLFVFLFRSAGRIFQTIRKGFQPSGQAFDVLAVMIAAGLAAILFHGIFESSLILGTSPNSVLLGFLVTRLDVHWRDDLVRQQKEIQRRNEARREQLAAREETSEESA